MLCHRCKKRPATFHETTVVGHELYEKHLCEQCAAEEGQTAKEELPIDQIIKKFVSQASAEELSQVTCSECGMTFVQFRNTGLLGCPKDYDAFSKALVGLLQRAHGSRIQHVGKVPSGRENKVKRQHELMRSKQDLEDAVQVEDYERAAVLRDKIAKLEQQ